MGFQQPCGNWLRIFTGRFLPGWNGARNRVLLAKGASRAPGSPIIYYLQFFSIWASHNNCVSLSHIISSGTKAQAKYHGQKITSSYLLQLCLSVWYQAWQALLEVTEREISKLRHSFSVNFSGVGVQYAPTRQLLKRIRGGGGQMEQANSSVTVKQWNAELSILHCVHTGRANAGLT